MRSEKLNKISEALALGGLEIGAIKIRPRSPFLWASGTYNPIYNDNRRFLFYPKYRRIITDGFLEIMNTRDLFKIPNLIIAGTSTSGIPHADRLAEACELPEIYIRDKPKDHGMKNQIEGIDAESDLAGFTSLLVEDLISIGGSSVSAVAAIRKANGICNQCISIFNYGLPDPPKMFSGEIAYNEAGDKLKDHCDVNSLLYYPELLSIGIKNGFIKKEEEKILLEWMENQKCWGALHGFPQVIK